MRTDLIDELLSLHQGPVVLHFWDDRVAAAAEMAAIMLEVEQRLERSACVVRLRFADHRGWAVDHGVHGVPTTLVFKQGRMLAHIRGLQGAAALLERILPCL